jgi:hypothetical protein
MGAGIVGVDDVGAPPPYEGTHPARRREVPVGPGAHGGPGEPVGPEAPDERTAGVRDDERLVPALTLRRGEEEDLALAAAPLASGVDVEDPKPHRREDRVRGAVGQRATASAGRRRHRGRAPGRSRVRATC